MVNTEIELRSQWVRLGVDGIFYIRTKPRAELDRADAEETIRTAGSLCDGKPRPALVDLNDLKSMTRDARLYYAGPETAKVQSAAALLIKSPLTRAIGNFFMGLNKPIIPTRLFTSEVDAIAWLRTFLT
jgi:hypothetical protein